MMATEKLGVQLPKFSDEYDGRKLRLAMRQIEDIFAKLGVQSSATATQEVGPPGADGIDGEDGLTIIGPQGPQGIPGLTIPGRDGEDAEDSLVIPGAQGPKGDPGLSIPGIDGADAEDWKVPPAQSIVQRGTWTGGFTFATPGDLSVTLTCPGTWVKIWPLVRVVFELDSSVFTHSTASSFARITGLPFPVLGNVFAGMGVWQGITKAGFTDMALRAVSGQSYLMLAGSRSGGGVSNVVAADMPSGGTLALYGSIIYITP